MRGLITGLVVAGVLIGAAAAAATGRPTLRVVEAEPLVVRASGFAAREQVRVSAATRQGTILRKVRAGTGGGFTVRFQTAFDFCAGITKVRALGAKSGAVAIRPTPRPCVDLQD